MQKKHFLYVLLFFFLSIIVYYSILFFTNQDRIPKTTLTAEQTISDFSKISSKNKDAVKYTYQFFTLDSDNNFNATKPLLRGDSLNLLNMIASAQVNKYSSITGELPYFKDFNPTDVDAESTKRLCNYIDKKEGFPKHYEILGYELKKSQPITRLEFMVLASSMIKIQPSGVSYSDVPTQFADEIGSLYTNNIISDKGKINASTPITREDAANIIYNLSKGKK